MPRKILKPTLTFRNLKRLPIEWPTKKSIEVDPKLVRKKRGKIWHRAKERIVMLG